MKNFKRLAVSMFMFVFIFTLTACSIGNGESKKAEAMRTTYPLTITDSYDRQVVIEKEPTRVVSLAPNITETIFALEKNSALVGRTDFCDYPSEVTNIQSVGGLKDPSIEKITELKPDLVIASTHFSKDTLNKLTELNIPVVVLYGEDTFDGAYDTIQKVGTVLNAAYKAETIVAGMKAKVIDIQNKVSGKTTPGVYYVVGFGQTGDYTATGETFISQMIKMAGGVNIAEDATGWKYSLEKLIEKNPEIVICSDEYDTKAGFTAAEGYKELNAVKSDKVLEINVDLLNRQGPRQAEGLEALAKLIHPEAFK